MKKVLPLFLAAALSMSLLTGCSSKPAETTAAVEATVAETTAAPETTAAETTAAPETTAAVAETTAAEATDSTSSDDIVIRIAGLKGPTTMGLVKLIDDASKGESENNYEFTMVTAADELTALVAGGKVDIALLPANVASVLYKIGRASCRERV